MGSIVAREKEIAILDSLMQAEEPHLLAVYGRRRIGKTFLITRYFQDKGIYFDLTGSDKLKASAQLGNFMVSLHRAFPASEKLPAANNWVEAFYQLQAEIEKLPKEKKVILFFDELPWLAKKKSGFLPALEYFWNSFMSRRNHSIVIICGSAAAWMIRHVISDKGGLYGRVTKKIHLQPFNLVETEMFLKSRNVRLARKEIVEIYMALGGVAKYLTYVQPAKSSAQNINEICFTPHGDLLDEFDLLYRSLFKNFQQHIKIIRALSAKRGGLTKNELLEKTQLKSGGGSSAIIDELVQSDFITYCQPFGNKISGGKYILIDEYSLFYLRWIEPVAKQGVTRLDPNYWLKQFTSHSFASWAGYSFESICQKHILQIKKALGIAAVSTWTSSWAHRPVSKNDKGAQIDLVIDRADSCINLCEIRFYNKEYVIKKEEFEKLIQKRNIFQAETKSRKTLFITFISSYGLIENDYYRQAVDGTVLTLEDLFT